MLRPLRLNPRANRRPIRNPAVVFTSSLDSERGKVSQGAGLSELILQAIYPQVNRVLPAELLAPTWHDPVRLGFTRKGESINLNGVEVRPLGTIEIRAKQDGNDLIIEALLMYRGAEILTPFDTAAVYRWARQHGAEGREALRYWLDPYDWERPIKEEGYYKSSIPANSHYGQPLARLKPEQISRPSTSADPRSFAVDITDDQLQQILRAAAAWGSQMTELIVEKLKPSMAYTRGVLNNIQEMVSKP